MDKHSYTSPVENVVVCNDCGAYAGTATEVKHHATCKPGEAKKWEKYYNRREK